MTLLNELIEDLYRKTVASTDRISAAADPAAPASENGLHDAHVDRIRRVLTEMSQHLTLDDQLRLDVPPPTDEIRLRIMNHWEQLTQSITGIHDHMKSLENDIAKMQPWGDFDVIKVEQLAALGVYVKFWRIAHKKLPAQNNEQAMIEQQLCPISQDAEWVYFVTINADDEHPAPVGAEPIEICPCPISTLIMLQTRDKDSLRRFEMLREDYALAHYSEMYAALRQALPPGTPLPQLKAGHRSLREKIRHLINRNS